MKRVFASFLAIFVLCAPVFAATYGVDTEFIEGVSVLKLVERSEIAVLGTVAIKHHVNRPAIAHSTVGTTDIVVRIDTLIKGEPNFGDNHIIFMKEGGRNVRISSEPGFKIGGQALLFLAKFDAYSDYPHDGLHLIHGIHGKKPVVDNTVRFWYLQSENTPITVQFDKDVVVNLAKAFMKDKTATIALEAEIKTFASGRSPTEIGAITLSNTLKSRLLTQSKSIANKKEQ